MKQPVNTGEVCEELLFLLKKYGDEDYDGEPVSQTSHMIQCAMQALGERADTELVLGAFLHDIGHLLRHQQQTEAMDSYGVVNHEGIGADYIRKKGFSERVCAVIEKHVDAKRYLVSTDPAYMAKLSVASLQTLEWQGGPMGAKEAEAFKKLPFFNDIIRVRLWDEKAKLIDAEMPPLVYFIGMIQDYLDAQAAT